MKIFFIFLAFLLLFFSSLTFYFNDFICQHDVSLSLAVLTAGLVLVAGIFLGLSFYFLKQRNQSSLKWVLGGSVISVLLFLIVTQTEQTLSERQLKEHNDPKAFAILKDHCGVYSGRSIQSWIHHSLLSAHTGTYRELEVLSRCRLTHFKLLEKNGLLGCGSLDPIDCRVKWMDHFALHGYWDYETRMFFYDDISTAWLSSKKPDALVNYVLKDQELESSKRSLLKQLGVEEEFIDQFLLIQQVEELKSLKLTEVIFENTSELIGSSGSGTTPNALKFKDLYEETARRFNRIPDLEKDVESLKVKSAP